MTPSNVGNVSRGFLSYTRQDNNDFNGVVDRLKRDLSARFHAQTGRQVDIFVDRDSIGWGQDWRQAIGSSVQSATVFIPVVTMRYFASDACRAELLAFYSSAKKLGVTELILPVILTGAHQISADDEREEVRLIESLNYKNIEQAWIAGYDSPQWRETIFEMVNELSVALTRAEAVLIEQERGGLTSHGSGSIEPTVSPNEQDQGEMVGDATAVLERFERLESKVPALVQAVERLGAAATDAFDGAALQSMSSAQQKAVLIAAANRLRQPALSFEEAAEALEREVTDADIELRAVVSDLKMIDSPQAREQLAELKEATGGLGELSVVLDQMDELTNVLKLASLVNVSVRHAIRPAVRGTQATRTAVATVESWRNLV